MSGREPSTPAVVIAAVLMALGLYGLIRLCIEAAIWIGQWA